MKSRLVVEGKPKEKRPGQYLVTLVRSLSEDGIEWKEVDRFYKLMNQEELEDAQKIDSLFTTVNEKAVARGEKPPIKEVEAPEVEGKILEQDTLEKLPEPETHEAGPPDEVKETVLEEGSLEIPS